jgi:alkanesulfonate monooxygenase SsuD/methylene tetrahydromethanopterin reductase-like flavin-dependent oxidoreductase (luciferase family)
VPRSPQGHPVRVVDATDRHARRTAARYADVAVIRVAGPAQARALRTELRDGAGEFGRNPDSLRVLAGLTVDLGDGEHAAEPGHGGGGPRQTAQGPLYRGGPVDLAELIASWHEAEAADGFHLTPVEPRRDLERLVNGTVALLQHRGLFRTFYPGSTLREHLGLGRPANQYAAAGGTP